MPLIDDPMNTVLTFQQKRMIQIWGKVYIGSYARPGWSGELPFYAFRCKKHGIVVNYPQGYSQRLECPKCRGE